MATPGNAGAAFDNANSVNAGGTDYSIANGTLVYSGSQPYALKNGQYYAVQNGQIANQATPLAVNPGEPTGSGAQIMAGSPGGPVAATSTKSTPIDYSQLLPSAQSYESFAPMSYQQFGSVPYVQASTVNPASVAQTPGMQAATVNPNSIPGANAATVNPNSLPTAQAASVDTGALPGALQSYEQSVRSAMAPQFAQQNDALTANLASRGIFNSSAGQQLQNNLSVQQDASLSSAYEPLISQFAGAYTAGNQQNASQQQATNLANYSGQIGQIGANQENTQAANMADYSGLLSQIGANQENQQAANATNYAGTQSDNQLLAQLQQQAGLSNQAANNTANTQNADAYGAITASNRSAYNNYLAQMMAYQNGPGGTLPTMLDATINSYNPSQYSNLLSQGMTNAGSAYTNAYNGGAAGTANLSSTLGNLGAQYASSLGSGNGGGADMGNASFGEF